MSRIGLVLALYFIGGRLGLAVPFTSGNVSPVWPPAGIAIAALLLFGYRIWPGLTIGAFLVNFLSPIPPQAAAGIAAGNTAGAVIAFWLLKRRRDFNPALTRFTDLVALIVFGAAGAAVSATVGNVVLSLNHVHAWSDTAAAWVIWWFGDSMGILMVAPLLLTLAVRKLAATSRARELWVLALCTIATASLVCSTQAGTGLDLLVLTLFPFVLWGAVRFEAGGAAAVSFLITAIAVWCTAHGLGPFVIGPPLRNAMMMQTFLAVIAVSGLAVATLVSERTELVRQNAEREAERRGEAVRQAEKKEARESILLLQRAVEQTADSVIVTDRNGKIQYVNPAFETTTGYGWDDAVGRTPAILKSGLHTREFYRQMWDELVRGHPFRGTLINKRRGGELYWAEQTITPVRDDEGGITHFVSVLKDVTEIRKRHEQEVQMRLAHDVQQAFYRLPVIAPPGLDLAAVCYPADETGGDYFDIIPAPDGSVYVAIGDASGHGFSSALVMALTRAYVRSFAAMDLDVGAILTRVNQMLAGDLEDNRYVTLLLAHLDGRNRLLSYANAGHVAGLVLDGQRGVEAKMESDGPPVGVFAHTRFATCQMSLSESNVLLLFTDGVTECANADDEQFGCDRVIEYACANCERTARDIADGVCDAARKFTESAPQTDDMTSVVVKVQ